MTNDSDFVSSTAINLVNYYLKSEVYTKSAVDELLRNVGAGLSVKIVDELPTEDISGTTIYLIHTSGSQYNQYMYIDDDWANLGSTSVDMSSYYNKTQIDNKLLEYITASALLSQLMNYTKTTDLATVARTNSYNDLDDLPEIPSTDGFMKARENIGEVDLDECTTAGLFAVKTTSDNLPDIPNIYGTYVALDVLTTTEFANQLVKLVVKHDDDTLEPMIWSRGIIFEDEVWGDWHQAYSDITTYTKDEIDTELDLKADKSTTYTKTETYNKTEVDALLEDKADTDDIETSLDLKADKSTTYTKTEVNTELAKKINKSLFDVSERSTNLNNLLAGESAIIVDGVTANAPCNYGYCICFCANYSWFFQIAFATDANMTIYIRTKVNSDSWNAWRTLIPS